MAEKLGISRNTLTNWKRGTKEIYGIKLLEEMAEILEVPLKILLSGEKDAGLGNFLNEVSQPEEKNFKKKKFFYSDRIFYSDRKTGK